MTGRDVLKMVKKDEMAEIDGKSFGKAIYDMYQ